MTAPPLSAGDVLAGKYLIDAILGEGGMGFVLGARNIALDEPVALEILRPEALSPRSSTWARSRTARRPKASTSITATAQAPRHAVVVDNASLYWTNRGDGNCGSVMRAAK